MRNLLFIPRRLGCLICFFVTTHLDAVEFFVSPQGSDDHPGTRERPFATIERARDALRALRRSGAAKEGATIWIAGGTYRPPKPLAFGREDSGVEGAPVVYRAARGAEVRLTGAARLEGFRPVTDPAILRRLDASARDSVRQVDLRALGISDFGEVTAAGKRPELFFDDRPMKLCRWPNEGFVRIVDVVGGKPHRTHGIPGNREGKFTYDGDRPARWKEESDIRLHGYWFWDWSDAYERVESIDIDKKVISTVPPYHHYGYRKGQRYYAVNLLSELDVAGEWYLDRQSGILYFWPPGPMERGRTALSLLPHLLVLDEASWLTFEGVLLEGARDDAVTIRGGAGCRVVGCAIRNGGSWGVSISGGEDHGILHCDLYMLGEGGVSVSGGDRATLTPAGHTVENNHIYGFGRLYRTYRPAVAVRGVGTRIAHNRIHDGPHNAIQLGGNDHLIEFNEIFAVCYETGDVGAFYMGRDWTQRGTVIRYNYFHDIRGPGLHGAMAVYLDDMASGIKVFGNVFHRAGRAAFIGGGRDNVVENNIFVDCAPSVHVDARGDGWASYHAKGDGTLVKRLRAVPYESEVWKRRYPRLVNILEDHPGLPKGNVIRRNISVGGKWQNVESKARPLVKLEDNLVDQDPHFVDAEKRDFRLRADSPAFERGFKPIPVEKIGLYECEHRRTSPGG